MISLPKEFTSTKYAGYFWNTEDRYVYSIKSGVLRRIKKTVITSYLRYKFHWLSGNDNFIFTVSCNGAKRILTETYLMSLKLKDEEIKVIK